MKSEIDMNVENYHEQSSTVFSNFEAALLERVSDAKIVAIALDKIHYWTGGEPLTTELLCNYAIKYSAEMNNAGNAEVIDSIVQSKILKAWDRNGAATHLKKLQETLLAYKPKDSLLILYLQILQGGTPTRQHSPEQAFLLKSGLVCLNNDTLKVSNAIYARVFDPAWLERQLPGITKPVSVIRTGPRRSLPRRAQALSNSFAVKYQPPGTEMSFAKKMAIVGSSLGLVAALLAYSLKPAAKVTTQPTASNTPSAQAASDLSRQGLRRLTLLGDTFSGYSTFRNADFQTVLKETDIEISYANEFDQTLRAQALNEGDADLIVTTLDQFLQQRPQGQIVGLLDRTVGADAVVLNTKQYGELTSLLALGELVEKARSQNKKLSIAYAQDTPSEYLALVLDTQFDTFNLSDFELKPVADASEAWALMQNPTDNVAIALLWEPFVTQAQQQGYTVALSSKDAPNAIVDVVVASDRLIAEQPEVISQLMEKYYRRIDANARDATQLQAQVADDGDLSVADAAAIIEGISFFTAIEAKDWFERGTLERRIGATAAILALSNRLEAVPTDIDSLYTEAFVTEAAGNTQALIDLIRADNPALADKLAGEQNAVEKTATSVSSGQIQASTDIGNLKTRGQVSFTANSAQLTAEGKTTLDQLAAELKEFNAETVAVRIIGHTSQTGGAAVNQTLSQYRADTVAAHLRAAGVKLTIVAEGKGFSEPLKGTNPAAAKNQRTEIRLVRVN